MKKILKSCLLIAVSLAVFSIAKVEAQTSNTPTHYKDMVSENPSADADIKIVSDFTNALVGGDIDKAKSFLASNCINFGPGPTDSTNLAQFVDQWQANYKSQSNRQVGFLAATFHVKTGNLQGNWVAAWGDYTFTANGITVKFPYHSSYHITKGKIDVSRIYYDQLYIFKTLGYTLTPPAGGK